MKDFREKVFEMIPSLLFLNRLDSDGVEMEEEEEEEEEEEVTEGTEDEEDISANGGFFPNNL